MPNNSLPKPEDVFKKQNALPKPSEILGEVKKKGSSDLDLRGVKPTGSSATKEKTTPQSSGSSSSDENIFKGYPGKEGKSYRLDDSTGKPVWYEYSGTVFKNGKQIDEFNKPITQPGRVDGLNKHFKQKASTLESEMTYTGYPGKESNEYQVRDGVWRRKSKGNDWEDIHNQKSIDVLNKQFNEDVKVNTARSKYAAVTVDEEKELKDQSSKKLTSINSKLIGKEEAEVVDYLKKQFPDFEFHPSGLVTDELKVIAPNGEPLTISLDNWTDKDDLSQSIVLRKFIEVNSNKRLNAAIDVANKTDKESAVKTGFNLETRRAKPGDAQYITGSPEYMQPLIADVKLVSKTEKQKLETDQAKAREEYMKQMSYAFSDAYSKQKEAARTGSKIKEKEAIAMFASIPTTDEAIKRGNEYTEDISKSYKSHADSIKKINDYSAEISAKIESGEITEEQLNSEYKPILDRMIEESSTSAADLKEMVSRVNNVDKSVRESVANNYLINEAKGSIGGGMAYKFVKGLTYLPRLISPDMGAEEQESLVRMIVGGGTTEEFVGSENRSDISKVLFSVSESMGALSAGGVFGGGLATSASFYGQGYYEMKDELDGIEGISDTEKLLMSTGYGLVSSVLEKFGIESAMGKSQIGKNLINNILKTTFKELPKNASKEFIEAALLNNAKMYLTKAGMVGLSASIVEGGTEGLQALTKVGVQEVYDGIKSTDYFNNKTGWEMFSDIAYESYLGALGGGIMNIASTSPKILSDGISKALSKEQIEMLMDTANLEGVDQALLTNLKASVISGKVTREQAKEIVDSFDVVKSKLTAMPEGMTTSQKSVALDLMIERSNIERDIKGKDPILADRQKSRIAEINNELKAISNATKENEQPVQEDTTEGSTIEYPRAGEGQQEEGISEGSQREATQQGADLGDSTIPSEVQQEKIENKSVEELEQRQSELEGFKSFTKESKEYSEIEKEVEKREWQSVLNAPLDQIISIVDSIMKKDKDMPNGYGSYMDRSDARQTKEIVEKYSSEVSKGEARKDFKDAFFGNPSTWYSDGLKLRESVRAFTEQGGSFKALLNGVQKEFEADGFTEQDAAAVINRKLSEITKVNNKVQQEKIVVDKPTIATNTATEVERVKSLTADAEDGATLNLDGSKYEGAGLVVPVDSMNTTMEELTPEMIADFVEERQDMIGDAGVVKAGLYKFPNSNQVSIDLSVVVPETSREQAIEFGKLSDQESLYDLGSGENVKTGGTGENPMKFTPEQHREIAKALKQGRVPNVFGPTIEQEVELQPSQSQINEVTNDNSADVITRIAEETKDARKISVAKAARSVIKSLPGVKVFLHNSTAEYRQAIADREGKTRDQLDAEEGLSASSGSYIDGEIHIDLSVANSETVFHEAFHHAFAKAGFKSGVARMMTDGLKRIVSDKTLIARIEKFESQYKEDSDANMAEEFLAELAAIITENKQILTPNNVERIKQLINSIAKKLGIPAIFKATDGRKEVLDFMNNVSKGMRTGIEIKNKEISADTAKLSRQKRMTEPVAGNKLFNEPLPDASRIADEYTSKAGIGYISTEKISKLDESNSKAIAAEYDKMKDNPTDPEVAEAYKAMIDETIAQYDEITSNGYVVEINNNEPYSSSGDMISDLMDNKRMKIFSTESGFGDEPITDEQRKNNPLLTKTKYKDANGVPLLANDLFRFVHDFFGHAKFGNGFGPVGEENAWRIHSAMYSDPARRAMTSETRGQNSWVNFSGINKEAFKLRDKARELRKEGKIDEAGDLTGQVYDMMKFADQKVGLMPEWVSETGARKKRISEKPDKNLDKKVDKSFRRPIDRKTVQEYTALKDQLRLEAKAARVAQKDMKDKQRDLVDTIKSMTATGKIKVTQAAILIKRIGYLNLDNQTMVTKFLDYAGKIFERADYQERLNEANSLRKSIKGLTKKDSQAETIAMGKEFSKIDPAYAEDIDTYIEMAAMVKESMRPSSTRGVDVIIRESANITEVSEYVNNMLQAQDELMLNELKDMYKDLVAAGVITEDMSYAEIRELLKDIEGTEETMLPKEKEKIVKDYIRGVIDTYGSIVEHIIKKGEDPFTGDAVVLTDKEKAVMSELLNIDLDLMDVKSALIAVDILNNFMTNKITSSAEALVSNHRGAKNAKATAASGFKAKDLGFMSGKIGIPKTKIKGSTKNKATDLVGRFWAEQFATIVTLSDVLFGGVSEAAKVLKDMGFTAFQNGVAFSTKVWNNVMDEYAGEFKNTKPNGEKFNTARNIYERGMYAFLSRTVQGEPKEQQAELNRKISQIKQSIKTLTETGSEDQKKMAVIYQELFDKLGLEQDKITITDIASRVDSINAKATEWWVSQWSKHYSDLSDVSLSVYNTALGKDINYTPSKYSKTPSVEVAVDEILEAAGGAFAGSLDYVYDKKTGVLMEANRTESMQPGRFVDFDFDTNNAASLKSALVDINTAAATRQMAGFMKSKFYQEIIPSAEDRTLFSNRIRSYVVRSRNKMPMTNDQMSAIERFSRLFSTMGAVKALGTLFQAPKQVIPVIFNTYINAGANFNPAAAFSRSVNNFIDRSGRSIANRGMESQDAIKRAHEMMDKASTTNAKEVLRRFEQLNNMWLKFFLAKPDIFIARASWIAYYKQDLKRQGLSSDVDFDTVEVNDDAADYAQHMVDRQQNISDSNMGGDFMASEDAYKKISKNMVLPFASFILNQKSRMYGDIKTLTSETASVEDRVKASRSLAGLSVEIVAFHTVGFSINYFIYQAVVSAITGGEPTDEEKEKMKKQYLQTMTGSIIKDILSPLPVTDGYVIALADMIAENSQDPNNDLVDQAVKDKNDALLAKGKEVMDEKTEAKFRTKSFEDSRFKLSQYEDNSNFGTFGIALKKYQEYSKLVKIVDEGIIEDEFNGRPVIKMVSDKDREIAKTMVIPMQMFLLGLAPADVSSVNRGVIKRIKNNSMTENQFEKMEDIKKELGRKELAPHEDFLVNTGRKKEGVLKELAFIEDWGGLTKDQSTEYVKLIKAKGKVNVDDLQALQKGQTAEQIIKKGSN